MTEPTIGWLIICIGVFANLWFGLRFRSGPRGSDLANVRNASLPRAVRNWLIVAPLSMILLIPTVFGGAFLLFDLGFNSLPGPVSRLLLLGGAGWFLLSLALISALLFRPPRVLVPGWLRDENSRVGYRSPSPSLFDWVILLLVGLPGLLLGVGLIAAAMGQLVKPS